VGRLEDGAVEGGSGDFEAGGYFGDWDVGGFEQGADGLDLFGREFSRAASLAAACPAAFKPATVRSRIKLRPNSASAAKT
jgi:hypothetical protein